MKHGSTAPLAVAVAARVRVRAAAPAALAAGRAHRRARRRVGRLAAGSSSTRRGRSSAPSSATIRPGSTTPAAQRIAYLYDGEPSWPGVWETVFFNTNIDRVYDLNVATVPGPLPQDDVTVAPGRDGGRAAVAPGQDEVRDRLELDRAARRSGGAKSTQQGLTQAGLVLWKLEQPLRLRSRISGLEPNGDISGEARLVAYDCKSGTFSVTLLIKQPEKVDIRSTASSSATSSSRGRRPGTATCRCRSGRAGRARSRSSPPA